MHIFKIEHQNGKLQLKNKRRYEAFTFLLVIYPFFVATPRGEHMCNERGKNGNFWGLILKPSMVTTRNCNIILKCVLFIFYMSRPNLSIHTTKGIYIYNFSIAIIGIQGVQILMENNHISC
jgi:hypothetical protein